MCQLCMVVCAPLPAEGLDLVDCDAQGGQGGPMRCLVLCSHALQQRHVCALQVLPRPAVCLALAFWDLQDNRFGMGDRLSLGALLSDVLCMV